jgi:hypothetical protein
MNPDTAVLSGLGSTLADALDEGLTEAPAEGILDFGNLHKRGIRYIRFISILTG